MQRYDFFYECPVCHDEAFFLDQQLFHPAGSVDVLLVQSHIAWDEGPAKITSKVRCQRCHVAIRHIAMNLIRKLNLPVMIPK